MKIVSSSLQLSVDTNTYACILRTPFGGVIQDISMITFFTALVFSYTIQDEKVTVRLWLNSYEQCLDAMISAEPMYTFMADNVSDKRIYMLCEKSSVPSTMTVKPRLRPDDL